MKRRRLFALVAVPALDVIQQHNPLLFDCVLKRSLRLNGAQLPASIFETCPFFERASYAKPKQQ